jgi:hypothetical protein
MEERAFGLAFLNIGLTLVACLIAAGLAVLVTRLLA